MRQQRTTSVIAAAIAAATLLALSLAPAEAASFRFFVVEGQGVLSSSYANQAGVDYVVEPGGTIQLRAIVGHASYESPQTLVINSTAGQIIPTRQIPPTPSSGGDVEYRTTVTVANTNDEVYLQLGAQTSGATKTVRVIVAPPPPSGTFTITSPSANQRFEAPDRAPSTRDGVVSFQWRVPLRVTNVPARASHAEWCWRSPASAAPQSVQNWQCQKTRRGAFNMTKRFWWENRNGSISGDAHLGGNQVKVRPCNVRGCGTDTPMRNFQLAAESTLRRRGRR